MANALAASLEKLLESRNYIHLNTVQYLRKDMQEHAFELDVAFVVNIAVLFVSS